MSGERLVEARSIVIVMALGVALSTSSRAADKRVDPNLPPSPFELSPALRPNAYNPLSNTNSVGLKSPKMNPQGDMIFTNWPGFSQPLLVPHPTTPQATVPQPAAPGAPTPSGETAPSVPPPRLSQPVLGIPFTYRTPSAAPTAQDLARGNLPFSHSLILPQSAAEKTAPAPIEPVKSSAAAATATAKSKSAITTNEPPRASIWERHKRVLEGVEYHW